jgi:hypothetical protein
MFVESVSPIYVSIFFAAACFLKIWQKQGEQAFPRFVLAAWYWYLWMHPYITVEAQRITGRWAILFLAFIEVVSYFMRLWQRKEYTKARQAGSK